MRRSPTECKHSSLPLDLHVLGLPLAFILSQDQTLHRVVLNNIQALRKALLKKFSGTILSLVSIQPPRFPGTTIRCQFQYLNELVSCHLRYSGPVFLSHSSVLRVQIYNHFPNLQAVLKKYSKKNPERCLSDYPLSRSLLQSGCKYTTAPT